jgi:dTDP-4-amino-4,6-dideoxygalactose transaminase
MSEARPPLLTRGWKWFFPRAAVPAAPDPRRLAPILAALGLKHLERLDAAGERRRRLAGLFDAAFADHPCIRGPAWAGPDDEPWPLRYPAYVRDYDRRPGFIARLAAAGYEAGPFAYPRPVSGQFPYYKLSRTAGRNLRGAWRAAYGLLNLPLHDEVTEEDVGRIVEAVGA